MTKQLLIFGALVGGALIIAHLMTRSDDSDGAGDSSASTVHVLSVRVEGEEGASLSDDWSPTDYTGENVTSGIKAGAQILGKFF